MTEREAADAVRARIVEACVRCGRDPAQVTLVAATKTVAPERIAASGIVDVGENRVQELLAKQDALGRDGYRWHFIGRLQRNKVRKVVGRVTLIHGIDSPSLLEAVDRAAHDLSVVQRVLVEVNLSGEATKGGCAPAGVAALVEAGLGMRHVSIRGLMTVPAPGDVAHARAAFRDLAALAREHDLPELSMGMSDDFEAAVEEGATIVRVGSAIFGERAR